MKRFEIRFDDIHKDIYGISKISLVDEGAIEIDWIFMNKQKEDIMLAKVNEEKQIITGPALIPDKVITRIDPETKEVYEIVFFADSILELSRDYLKNKRVDEVNINHEIDVDDVYVVESWIIEDSNIDKARVLGFDLPIGTWMITMKVNNLEIFNKIKSKELNGFSIEAKAVDNVITNMKKDEHIHECGCGCGIDHEEVELENELETLLIELSSDIEIDTELVEETLNDYEANWIYNENDDKLTLKDIYELIEFGEIEEDEDGDTLIGSIQLSKEVIELKELLLAKKENLLTDSDAIYTTPITRRDNRKYAPGTDKDEKGKIGEKQRPKKSLQPPVPKGKNLKERIQRKLQGKKLYQWTLSANGSPKTKSCPHCSYYAGQIRPLSEWLKTAVPSMHQTFCKQYCHCALIKMK